MFWTLVSFLCLENIWYKCCRGHLCEVSVHYIHLSLFKKKNKWLLHMDFVKLSKPLNCLSIERSMLLKSPLDFCLDGLRIIFSVDSVHFHMLCFLIAFLLVLERKLKIRKNLYHEIFRWFCKSIMLTMCTMTVMTIHKIWAGISLL